MVAKTEIRFSGNSARKQGVEMLGFSGLARLRWRALVNAFEVW